jgi:vitamin B12 transporter
MVGTNTDKSVLVKSSFASVFLKNNKGLNLELGARNVSHEQFGNSFTYSINPSVLIKRTVKIFADYSTAFKAPTLSQLYGPYNANPELDPELGRHLEGGLQYFSANGKVDVRVTAFKRNIDDVITYVHYSKPYVNLDEQKDKGLEVEPTLQFNDKLRVALSYAYVTGEITTKVGGEGADTTYHNLLRRPKHSFGLNAGYQFTDRLFVSLNAKTFGERDDAYFDNSTFTTKAVTLDAYALFDVYAEYFLLSEKQIRLFVDVRNILDEDYTEVTGYNTMGINLMAGVSFSL